MKLRKVRMTRFVLLSAMVVGMALVLVGLFLDRGTDARVRFTRVSLVTAKAAIKQFRDEMGRFPSSLQELRDYCNTTLPEGDRDFREFISNPIGNYSEHRMLDNRGGWLYDPNSGVITVNLTDPIKYYLPHGSEDNEIPSSW